MDHSPIRKPWSALIGKITVEAPTERAIRDAANRHYCAEMAAIAAEPDPVLAQERAARLGEAMDAALASARMCELSPAAGRLMKAMEGMESSPLPPPGEVIFSRHDARHGAPNKSTPPMLPASSREPCTHGSGAVQDRCESTAPTLSAAVSSPADTTSGGDRRPTPEVTLSTRRNRDEGDAAQPHERGTRTQHAGSTKGGRHENLAAPKFPLTSRSSVGRSGSAVGFGAQVFDSRRA